MSLLTESHRSARQPSRSRCTGRSRCVHLMPFRCFRIGAGASKNITRWSARVSLTKTTRLNFSKDGLSRK